MIKIIWKNGEKTPKQNMPFGPAVPRSNETSWFYEGLISPIETNAINSHHFSVHRQQALEKEV